MLTDYVRQLFTTSTLHDKAAKRTSRQSRNSGFRNSYAELESRQMLAAVITFDGGTGVITVTGTAEADEVTITENGVEAIVTVTGGDTQAFDLESLFWLEFYGQTGDDIVVNSSFVDTFLYGHGGNDTLGGGFGRDVIRAGPGNDIITGGNGPDELFGQDGDDTISGGSDADMIRGGNGADTINGGAGNDDLKGDAGDDIINGDDGDDTITGFTGVDTINGGNGDDKTYGQAGADFQDGGAGDDVVRGGQFDDTLIGGAGNDYIQGDRGNDLMYGGDGADTLIGFDGDDYMEGNDGDDKLYGQNGDDELYGGAGEDVVRGHTGNDLLYGGDDNDFIDGDDGNDVLYGDGGNDKVIGDLGDDELHGGDGVDKMFGNDGNDVIRGDAGVDTIDGGAGNDSIAGGTGANDNLTGGSGLDRFLTTAGDVLTDQHAIDDARLIFQNETSNWNDTEIGVLDDAFQQLFDETGSNRLLRDSVASGDLTLYKYADLGGSAGINYLSYSYIQNPDGSITYTDFDREIHILDWNESNASTNVSFQAVVQHEIGHNWDSELELTQAMPSLAGEWADYMSLSGWVDTDPGSGSYTLSGDGNWWYLNTASFADSYGRTNPHEDISTIWELHFSGDTTTDPGLLSKLSLLDDIFTALS